MTAYLFDTETTDRKDGEIIEACTMALLSDLDLFAGTADESIDHIRFPLQYRDHCVGRYSPSKPITTGAMAVHHILPSELEGMPPSAEYRLPGDATYIIGHSVDFDWEAAGKPDVKRVDTHVIAQWLWPDATGYSLVALIYMLKGATPATRELVKGAHGADRDCLLAFELLNAILELKPDIRTWSALWAFSEECRIPRTCPMKKYEGVLLEELDDGFIDWCLRQSWLDPYFRKGLDRVVEKRCAGEPVLADYLAPRDDDPDEDDDLPF